jgi:D-inositol-3-phosphate glycosyltransferase
MREKGRKKPMQRLSLETIAERLSEHLHCEQIGGCHFPRAELLFPDLSPTEFPPLIQVLDRPWRGRLLWAGRVIEEKGIETAINAVSYLPTDTTLDIVGPIEQAYRQRLEALAATLGVASQLSFSLASRQQMRQHYQQADVTLFTSMMEHEAFGLVPLEAMASGCPVIATGVGGSSEYCLDVVNCMRVPPGDSAALAHAVRQLAQSRDLLRRLVEGERRTASACTLDRQAAGIERSLLAASGFSRA